MRSMSWPIIIGRSARIESRTTFHALLGTMIEIGDNVHIGDDNLIHGSISTGDNFDFEDNCVVFNVTIENSVVVRTGATVTGEITIRERSIVPESFVVETQEQADALPQQ